MTDAALVAFLEWAVARLGLRWRGVGSFRSTVRKRLTRRLGELGLADLEAYRARLETDASEWAHLEAMCRIPISRLYRDAAVFDRLAFEILPERARAAEREGRANVRVWSAGCASGEEPYTLAMIWRCDVAPSHPTLGLDLVATDADETMLARARRGAYGAGSVRELPSRLREHALRLERDGAVFVVDDELRAAVRFEQQDLRRAMQEGPFDVVLCRNMLLTYIDEKQQPALLEALVRRVMPGGALVVGARETMPTSPAVAALSLVSRAPGVFLVADGRDSRRA
jgi:chemotaxis protein methyltransferase CheR